MQEHTYLNDSNPVVTLKVKDYGTITLQLFNEVAPNTVSNFIEIVERGLYTSSIFHRIIPGFMIQGGQVNEMIRPIKGDFITNGVNNPLKHTRGVISMARTMIKDSATSQFFIMHKDSPHLDGQYAAFGMVTSGIEVVDQIAKVRRDQYDKPYEDVVIELVTVDLKGKSYPKTVRL